MGFSSRRQRRSHWLVAAGIAVAVLAGLGGGSAFAYSNLKGRADRLQAVLTADLQAGQRELEAGKVSLTQANAKHDPNLITQAVDHLAAAKVQFLAASQLADNSRLLHYLEQIPAAGSFVFTRHTAVDGVAGMGVALSDAGLELANLDGQLINPPGTGQAARTLLTILDQAKASLVKVRLDLDRAQRAADLVDVHVLPVSQQSTFLRARDAMTAAGSGVDELERLVPVLKEVLGGNGPRTYLIEQVNPAELRAGGGFIGTYSLVRAVGGSVTLTQGGSAGDLAEPRPLPGQPGFIPQPGPYREVIPDISWSFLDSNLFPDFVSNARAALGFVEPRLGTSLDGVLAIDYYAVAKMLELTGPLVVPGFGLTVNADNFISQIVQSDVSRDASHKAILSAIAGPLMERLTALPPGRWSSLITSLSGLAAARHLQAYFKNELVEGEIDRVGWSGAVNPTGAGDYMMEVESNYYGDKANYFVTRHYTVVLTRNGGTLHHQVTVDLVNNEPAGSEARTSYRVNVRLYIGGSASSPSNNLRPVNYPNPAPPAGSKLLDGWLPDILCCGGNGQAVFEYDTPWLAQDRGIDQFYWQKQPGTVSDRIDLTWNDGAGHTFKFNGDLGQDRVITMSPTGITITVGQPAQAQLPSLNLG